MFSLSRRAANAAALKSLAKNCRFVCSNQSLSAGNSSSSSYNDPDSKGDHRPAGYGEKEICLLTPIDSRTPLPGNTGVVPNTFPQESFNNFQRHDSKRSSELTFELPDDRYRNALSQLACATVEQVVSSRLLECKAHECPQLLRKDFADLFPKMVSMLDNFTVLTLSQKTQQDMSQWNEEVETERANMEESFLMAAQAICGVLRKDGYWADFIHPTSGKPALGSAVKNATMYETDVRYSHFGFTVEDLGCCKVVCHHLWGTHVFNGAIFTNAPVNSAEIKAILTVLK